MSDIPKARELLQSVLVQDHSLNKVTQIILMRALKLMRRAKYIRRAPAQRQVIDREVRSRIRHLAASTLTQHQIANRVGLRSSGRISEVLNGKR